MGPTERLLAYAAALGAAPAALAVFAQGGTDVAWSSYRGSWQLIEIETNTWSWPQGQGAAVTVSAMTALISIHGTVHIASEASLAGLLPVVEGRLRELARRLP
jgi:hypothetical protein